MISLKPAGLSIAETKVSHHKSHDVDYLLMVLKALKMFQRGLLFVDYFSQERVQVHTLPSFYYACLNCP